MQRQHVSFCSENSTDRPLLLAEARKLSGMPPQSQSQSDFPEVRPRKRPRHRLCLMGSVVARSMFGFAGHPLVESERSSGLACCRSPVGSLTPGPHLRLVTAQSQEQPAWKHFRLLRVSAKVQGRRQARQ
jgi:hypothetical protein